MAKGEARRKALPKDFLICGCSCSSRWCWLAIFVPSCSPFIPNRGCSALHRITSRSSSPMP
eukprot:89981-Amphidinium_carterae.1